MNMSGFGLYGGTAKENMTLRGLTRSTAGVSHGKQGGGGHGGGGGGQVSSATSDPSTAHMRVFVGNLNTANISQQQVSNLFSKFGTITGLSVHRGYAFVQYASEASARLAVARTQNQLIDGQYIDVNIAAEPKPNQKPFSGTDSYGVGGNDGYDYSNNYGYGGNFSEDVYMPKSGGFGMGGMNKNSFGVRGGRVGKGAKGRGNFAANNNKKRTTFNKQMFPNMKSSNGSSGFENVNTDMIRVQLMNIRSQINDLISLIPKSSDQQNTATSQDTTQVKQETTTSTASSMLPPPHPTPPLA